MDDKKLIIPAEVKVCATCSYWDGERNVDQDVGVVVVRETCHGECLVKGAGRPGLLDTRSESECMWEALWTEDPQAIIPGETSGNPKADERIRLDGEDGSECPLPGAAGA